MITHQNQKKNNYYSNNGSFNKYNGHYDYQRNDRHFRKSIDQHSKRRRDDYNNEFSSIKKRKFNNGNYKYYNGGSSYRRYYNHDKYDRRYSPESKRDESEEYDILHDDYEKHLNQGEEYSVNDEYKIEVKQEVSYKVQKNEDISHTPQIQPPQPTGPTKESITALIIEKEESIAPLEEELKRLTEEKEKLLNEIQDLYIYESKRSSMEKEKERYDRYMSLFKRNKFVHYKPDEDIFFKPKKSYKEPQDFVFYKENYETHQKIKHKIIEKLKQKRLKQKEVKIHYANQYMSTLSKWKSFIRHKEAEEATEEFFSSKRWQMEQQFGERKFPLRRSREESSEKKPLHDEEEEIDEERFVENIADIPEMEIFNPDKKYSFIDNNGYIDMPISQAKLENSSCKYWFPEEVKLFKKLIRKYRKDFVKIASFLPNKTMKDVILFYYRKKYELKLGEILQLQRDEEVYEQIKASIIKNKTDKSRTQKEKPTARLNVSSQDIKTDPASTNLPKKNNEESDDDDFKYSKNKQIAKKTSKKISKAKSHWTDDEKSIFMKYLTEYGKDWDRISGIIKTKTPSQVKNYFQNYRVKLNLYQLLPEHDKASLRQKQKKSKE